MLGEGEAEGSGQFAARLADVRGPRLGLVLPLRPRDGLREGPLGDYRSDLSSATSRTRKPGKPEKPCALGRFSQISPWQSVFRITFCWIRL